MYVFETKEATNRLPLLFYYTFYSEKSVNDARVVKEGDLTAYNHTTGDLKAFYFHPDHLGSSSYITNGDRMVSQHMEYLPFGETLVDEHTNSINSPFKFNGKEKDEETGNYFYGARYYDPKWSIFISVDPLAEQTGDAYGYCYQNPINLVDPDGKSPKTDYFSALGKFVARINDGRHEIKVYDNDSGKYVSPSALNYSKKSNVRAMLNIAAGYLSQKGWKGILKITNEKGKGAAYADGNKDINIRTSTLENGFFDNYGNLKSAMNHEKKHTEETPQQKAAYTFLDHARIYGGEAAHNDFAQTSTNYKINNANQFVNRLLNSIIRGEFNIDVQSEINNYNTDNKGGVKIAVDGSLGPENAILSIRINGKLYESKFKFEKLDLPQD